MAELAFVLSVALAHGMTNLDNLAMLFALAPVRGVLRTTAAYGLSQALAVGLAAVVGSGAFAVAHGGTHWLGLLPIGLGVVTLWRSRGASADVAPREPASSLPLLIVLFLGLGIDSFVVTMAIFAESIGRYRWLALLGAALSIGLLIGTTLAFSKAAARAGALTRRLEALSPFVMILVGLYILLDTPTDVD